MPMNRYKCLEQQEFVDLVCDFLEQIAPLWSVKKSETLAQIKKPLKTVIHGRGKGVDKEIVEKCFQSI